MSRSLKSEIERLRKLHGGGTNDTRTSSQFTEGTKNPVTGAKENMGKRVGKVNNISGSFPNQGIIPRDFSNKQLTVRPLDPEFYKTYSATSENLPVPRRTIVSNAAGDKLIKAGNVGAGAVGLAMMGKDLYNRYQTGTLGMGDPSDPLSPANTDFVDTLIDKRKRNELPYYYKDLSQEQVTVPEPDFGDVMLQSIVNQPDPIKVTSTFSSHPNTKEDFKNLANNSVSAPALAKKEINNWIDNKSITEKEQDLQAIQRQKAEGKPLGQFDSFLDALTYFLPTALGGALGLAFGGVEAGVAGATNAQNLYGGYLDQKNKQFANNLAAQELDLKKFEAFNKATKQPQDKYFGSMTLQTKDTGEPVFQGTDKDGNPFLRTANGRSVDSRNVINTSTKNINLQNQYVSERQDKTIALNEDKQVVGALKGFKSHPPNRALEELSGAISQLNTILSSGAGITEGFISNWVAKGIQGQKGTLTDKDIQRAAIPMRKDQSIQSAVKEYFEGDMTEEKKAKALELIGILSENATKQLKEKINGYAKSNAKFLRIPEDELNFRLHQQYGIDNTLEQTDAEKRAELEAMVAAQRAGGK